MSKVKLKFRTPCGEYIEKIVTYYKIIATIERVARKYKCHDHQLKIEYEALK